MGLRLNMIKQLVVIATITYFAGILPAHAGFQFTAPVNQSTPMANPGVLTPMQAAPVPNVSTQPVKPLVNANTNNVQPVPAFVPAPITTPAVSVPAPQPQQARQKIDPENLIAVGFGNDLPLMTALKQIIPSHYTYKMDPNVSVNKKINWTGGDQWQVVLSDALRPSGLGYTLNNHLVEIHAVQLASPYPLPPVTSPAPVVETVAEKPKAEIFPIVEEIAAQPQPLIQNVSTVPSPPQNILPVTSKKSVNILPQNPLQSPVMSDEQQWLARNGDSLKDVLENWANLADVGLFWSSDYDYPLQGDVNLTGDFETAAQTLLEGFQNAKPRPAGRLHPNLPHGPAVLVIETSQTIK